MPNSPWPAWMMLPTIFVLVGIPALIAWAYTAWVEYTERRDALLYCQQCDEWMYGYECKGSRKYCGRKP